jgi:RNA polymerase sigma-70 factor (ECF subfamily)
MGVSKKAHMAGPNERVAYTHRELPTTGRPAVETVSSPALTSPAGPAPALPPFRDLYEKYFAFTWRSLRYLGVQSGHLDDAVQEVWVVVHRRYAEFEGRSDIKTWLFGITVNVQRNLFRAGRRHSGTVALPSGLASPVPNPMLEREGREAWSLVLSFLDTLDDTRRAVFVSSLLEGMSPAETAEITGLDVATVYHRTSALRRSFRNWVRARQGEP